MKGIEEERGFYGAICRAEPRYIIEALVETLPPERQTVKAAIEAVWLVTSSWGPFDPVRWTFRHYWRSMRSDLRRFCRTEVEGIAT